MSNKEKSPESLMMSYGYDPHDFLGSIKPPIFQTSTFEFSSAEEGKAFFELVSGKRALKEGDSLGYIYSRLNNPNLDWVEKRLCVWDGAEAGAVFESGMAAISSFLFSFLKHGDLLLFSSQIYGGTDHFIRHVLAEMGVDLVTFTSEHSKEEIIDMVENTGKAEKLRVIYAETPANPTNSLIDIEMCREIADYFSNEERVIVGVDNTYMGPLWSHPIEHGADAVLYSATKYIGGHSDIVAGACVGSTAVLAKVKKMRSNLGGMASPNTAWLLTRSLETLKVRMEAQAMNASKIADFLLSHEKVEKVYYLGFISESDERAMRILKKQYSSPGAMISFDIRGGEEDAFRFLNALKLIKLAVSLGSTESLAEHPDTMTHSSVAPEDKLTMNITSKLIRISVGVENAEDLIDDLKQALLA